MSQLGHERRPMQQATAPQLPLCPVSDRGRVAAQYVVEGQKRPGRDGSGSGDVPFSDWHYRLLPTSTRLSIGNVSALLVS
jgi:hypothetical protein